MRYDRCIETIEQRFAIIVFVFMQKAVISIRILYYNIIHVLILNILKILCNIFPVLMHVHVLASFFKLLYDTWINNVVVIVIIIISSSSSIIIIIEVSYKTVSLVNTCNAFS